MIYQGESADVSPPGLSGTELFTGPKNQFSKGNGKYLPLSPGKYSSISRSQQAVRTSPDSHQYKSAKIFIKGLFVRRGQG